MSESYPASLLLVVKSLRDRLAEDIRVLFVRDVSTITDYFVIATGNSTPHLRALGEDLDIARKEEGFKGVRKGGDMNSGWLVMDFGNVVVHLMTSELREFYALEKLWSDAKTIEIPE
jgi:ribosome-associated protein